MVNQGTAPWCGPGSLAMVLGFWSLKNVTIEEVGNTIDSENDGAYPSDILKYLKNLNIPVVEFNSSTESESLDESFKELRVWILSNHPIIVDRWFKTPGDPGHWCVIVGFDAQNIYTNDPNGFKKSFSISSFRELWKYQNGYGIVVNPLDSDGDTLTDDLERERFHTNPFSIDTDKDGLSDGEEVRKYSTNPLKQDSDGDGWGDKMETTTNIIFNPLEPLLPNALFLIAAATLEVETILEVEAILEKRRRIKILN